MHNKINDNKKLHLSYNTYSEPAHRDTPLFYKISEKLIRNFENIGSIFMPFGTLYNMLFYQNMISKEVQKAEITPGMRLLHIGSGALPLTALSLAKKGFEVHAVDNNPRAVDKAKHLVSKYGLESNIELSCKEGDIINCSNYKAVWISMHVHPKGKIIRQALGSLPPEGRLIYRNSRGWLTHFYPEFNTANLQNLQKHRIPFALGKETIIIRKRKRSARRFGQKQNKIKSRNKIKLIDIKQNEKAVILSVPDNPLLAPLGIRPGKQVQLQARESFGGPLLLEIEGRKVALGRKLAHKILLKRTDQVEL